MDEDKEVAASSTETPLLLREITPRNVLSLGPQTEPIALQGLNVLSGPNGSGKSNLIDLIGLLQATTACPRRSGAPEA